MYKGIYIALSGATIKQTHMDLIANNLANASTPGFKRDKISFQDYLVSQLNGLQEDSGGKTLSSLGIVKTDFLPGGIVHTGNPLDVAIDGEGLLSLENGLYTRRGDLHLDNDGYIVNQRGIKVLGNGGPIQITDTGRIDINDAGEVSVNDSVIDTLKVVEFKDADALVKAGDDAFTAGQDATESKAAIKQGYIEKSNVDAVKEMVQMITVLREFQVYQKAIQSFDDAIGRVLSDMPRI